MSRIKDTIYGGGFALLLFLVMLFALGFCSGCKVLRKIDKVKTDTVYVSKVDSGAVKTDTSKERRDAEWWREIITIKDTSITNVLPVVTYVKEGGKSTEVINRYVYDSSWREAYDSLVARTERLSKDTKTSVLNLWHIVAIAAGVSLVIAVVSKLKVSFR